MSKIIFLLVFSNFVFSQNNLESSKKQIDQKAILIDDNKNNSISIGEGYIKLVETGKQIGYSTLTFRDLENKIVKINESIGDKNYTTKDFYYSNDSLILIRYREEKHSRKNEISIIENCSIYIFGGLVFLPQDQTKKCALSFKEQIINANNLLRQEYEIHKK